MPELSQVVKMVCPKYPKVSWMVKMVPETTTPSIHDSFTRTVRESEW